MADQSVRITDMPDNSAPRVGLDLYRSLSAALPEGKAGVEFIEQRLNLFAACVSAAKGYDFKGDLAKLK